MTSLRALRLCWTAIFMSVCVGVADTTKIENGGESPFRVIWNYPDQSCQVRNIDLELSKYGIVTNQPRTFVGNEVATLYSSKVGLWPSLEGIGGKKTINGGIPQLGNLTAHLEKLRKDIASQIQEDSSGYGVIDQEVWRTLYDLNYGYYRAYKHTSVREAGRKHGSNDSKERARLAEEDWNKSARIFMEQTLLEVRALRPNVRWGYYLYPKTWRTVDQTTAINDRMAWLYQASTGFYPSIYLNDLWISASDIKRRVEATLTEAIRVRAVYGQANTPIVAYTIVQSGSFFSKEALDYAIGLPAEMGIDGIILWGSSKFFKPNPADKCNGIKTYVRDVLGPYVSQLMDRFTNCSISKCGGRGRCVRKDYAQSAADILEKSSLRRQARAANVDDDQEEIDSDLKHDGYQMRVGSSSRGINRFSSLSNRKRISLQRRRREQPSSASVRRRTREQPSSVSVRRRTREQPSSVSVRRRTREQPSSVSVRRRTREQPSSVSVRRRTREQPSSMSVRRRRREQPSSMSVRRRRREQPSSASVNRHRRTTQSRTQTQQPVSNRHSGSFSSSHKSNAEQKNTSENNTFIPPRSIARVEPVRQLVHRAFQNSHQNTRSQVLLNSLTYSINTNVDSLHSANKTSKIVVSSPRKGFSVHFTGHTLLEKLTEVYNYYSNITQKQHYTVNVRSDTPKIPDLEATQLNKSLLFHNEISVVGSNMSRTKPTTHSHKSYLSTRVLTPGRSVQVKIVNPLYTVDTQRTETSQPDRTDAPVEESPHISDQYDNYVCQCYNQWKGPSCQQSNSV